MPSTSSSSRNWTVFHFISAYMILLFLWRRARIPAHEYSMRTGEGRRDKHPLAGWTGRLEEAAGSRIQDRTIRDGRPPGPCF